MIVMKFGGSSVEDARAIRRVAQIVAGREHRSPAVVVSAMGGVTDRLVAVSRHAASGDLRQALSDVEDLRSRHRNAARELLGSGAAKFEGEVEKHFADCVALAERITKDGELSPSRSAHMLSFGEVFSSLLVAAAFEHLGLPAAHADSRALIVTDNNYCNALPLAAATRDKVRASLLPLIEQKQIPVLGGFIGSNERGEVTTLGRGGSDYSAAIFGAALNADSIEIWTDVSGIYSTDPRLCPLATPIPEISFNEATELACFGAKVLHPATLLPAVEENIPVVVLNSREPQAPGTRIVHAASGNPAHFRAIALKRGAFALNVRAPRHVGSHKFLSALFQVLERHHLPCDLVSISGASASVALDLSHDPGALINDLECLGEVELQPSKAIISLVGEDIRGRIGIASEVFSVVAQNGINIHMITQGASEISISFVVEEEDAVRAVQHLHRHLFEQPNASLRAAASAESQHPGACA